MEMDRQGMEPAYDAVIPAPVRYCDQLQANAKLLYGEIRSLTNRRGYCWADNDYFAKLYDVAERSIARWIAQLAQLNFITVVVTRDDGGHVNGRRIFIDKTDNVENADTLTHMTKKSARLTKLSGQNDKNVSQDIINNNIKKKENTRGKKADSAAALEELTQWAREQTDEPGDLIAALTGFCEARDHRGNPISPGRACAILRNKLIRFATVEGVCYPRLMAELLDKAVFRNWDSVYELKADEIQAVLDKQPGVEEVEDKWL